MFTATMLRAYLLLVGIACGLLASAAYFYFGYHAGILYLWLFSLCIPAIHFLFLRQKPLHAHDFTRHDFYIILAILLVFAPLYLAFVYTVPFQINTDEIAIMMFAERLSSQPSPDVFALSDYFNFPSFIFILFGWLGKLIGGIDLFHMRVLHASSGVAIIIFSYLLFRTFSSHLYATAAAALVGSNHVLLAISRMAMRDNTGLLFEVAALFFLFFGFRRGSPFFVFLGGIIAGLAFYSYAPGRLTFGLWLLLLVLLALFMREKIQLARLVNVGIISILGFVLAVAPLFVATIKELHSNGDAFAYQRQQILIFPEGRELQQWWEPASSRVHEVRDNILRGLFMFTNDEYDRGYIYPHHEHGFVDPLTGMLIWIGLLSFLVRPKLKEETFLLGAGFLVIWLAFSFLTTKNPNYTRLLVILPFVAFVTVYSLRNISSGAAKLLQRLFRRSMPRAGIVIFVLAIIAIVQWNLIVFGEFALQGLREGDDVGSTARYIEARKDISQHSFYLAASTAYPYYRWGEPWQWDSWMRFFAKEQQTVRVLDPDGVMSELGNPPFSVFMSQSLWRKSEEEFIQRYPWAQVFHMKSNGSLVAIEVR